MYHVFCFLLMLIFELIPVRLYVRLPVCMSICSSASMSQYLRVSLLTYISVDSGLVGVYYNNGCNDNVLATAVATKIALHFSFSELTPFCLLMCFLG